MAVAAAAAYAIEQNVDIFLGFFVATVLAEVALVQKEAVAVVVMAQPVTSKWNLVGR